MSDTNLGSSAQQAGPQTTGAAPSSRAAYEPSRHSAEENKNGLVLHVDYTAWGWTYLIGGIIMVAAGAALFAGQMWARVVAVALALASAVLNMAFFSAYPWWSAIMITFDVLVIWAVTVHGSEMKARR